MNVKKIAGSGLLLAVLLSGCGEKSTTEAAQTTGQQAAAGQAQANAAPSGQGNRQSNTQFEMIMAINTLMRMDKTDGLAITKEQAAVMLPIVEKAAADGQWSTELTDKLHAPLNEKQAAFLKENTGNPGGGRNGQGGQGGQGGGPGQGQGGRGQGGQGGQAGQAGQNQQSPSGQPGGNGGRQSPAVNGNNTGSGQAPSGEMKPNASQAPGGQGGGRMNGGGGFGGGMDAKTVAGEFLTLLKAK